MAVGTPVVGYRVGGVAETVVDFRSNAEGTGLLARPESVEELSEYIYASLILSKAAESGNASLLSTQGVIQTGDPKFWFKVRENAVKRVSENFTWDAAREYALQCYRKSIEMARYRTMASF
jgi:starch synthase